MHGIQAQHLERAETISSSLSPETTERATRRRSQPIASASCNIDIAQSSSFLNCRRQLNHELRTSRNVPYRADPSVMLGHDAMNDRKSQSRPATLCRKVWLK